MGEGFERDGLGLREVRAALLSKKQLWSAMEFLRK